MHSNQILPREFAAIDLGSNSFHMIVARIVNGSIQVLSRLKRRVRLAEGLDADNVLSQEAIERGVACLALFAKRLQGFSPENVKVVGTYTLRRAANKHEFLAQAQEVFPFRIEIITGQEEAKLIYSGVSHTQAQKGRKLVVDIGGGSTEMTIGDGFTPLRAESRHMGCVSFAKRFFPNGELTRERFEAAYQSAMEKIEDLGWEYRELGWKYVFGSSGTIKTVSTVLIASGYKDGIINENRLQNLIEKCLAFNNLNTIQLKGLIEERADVLVPGLAILLALFRTFQIQTMRYSDGALREGVMYGLENAFLVGDIRQRTAEFLAEQYHIDHAQALRVRETALGLFDQVTDWKNKRQIKELRSMLKWATMLHEVGLSINHKNSHRHSAYIIANSDLPGFDSEQQNLLAMLMRFYIGPFNKQDLRGATRFQYRDIVTLLRLFRLAVLLNRFRQATAELREIILTTHQSNWQLEFEPEFLQQNLLICDDLKEEQRQISRLNLVLSIC